VSKKIKDVGRVFIPQARIREIRYEEAVLRSRKKRMGEDDISIVHHTCRCGVLGCVGVPIATTDLHRTFVANRMELLVDADGECNAAHVGVTYPVQDRVAIEFGKVGALKRYIVEFNPGMPGWAIFTANFAQTSVRGTWHLHVLDHRQSKQPIEAPWDFGPKLV
jgi:hypothetical protein